MPDPRPTLAQVREWAALRVGVPGKLVASQILDDSRWGIITDANSCIEGGDIIVGVTARLSEQDAKALCEAYNAIPALCATVERLVDENARLSKDNQEWLKATLDKKREIFLSGARAQRAEDIERAKRFDAWFDLKEPRGHSLSEEFAESPLVEFDAALLRELEGGKEKG